MSERNLRLDNFYKCKYGEVIDAWRVEDNPKPFSVLYLCNNPDIVEATCLEADKGTCCNYIDYDCTCLRI